MTVEGLITVAFTSLSLLLAPLIYIWKNVVKRIDTLETKINAKMDEQEVRVLLADKLDPMKEDLHEVKALLHRILDIQLNKKP